MLITVWILGAVIVSMCGALFTLTKASDFNRRSATVEAELRTYADALRATPYHSCAASSTFSPASWAYTPTHVANSLPTDGTASVQTTVDLWNATADAGSPVPSTWVKDGGGFPAAAWFLWVAPLGTHCNTVPDDGLQRILVTVSDNGSPPVSASATIYKRATS